MRLPIIFTLSAALVILSCDKPEKPSEDNTLKFSSTYKAPQFPDSNRTQKLQSAFSAVDKIYREHAEKNHFPGIAYGVVADGKLIHSGATGLLNLKTKQPATTKSLFRIASMTKSFTAMAIMKLRDEGKLNLTDAAEKYIPEMQNFEYLTKDASHITIQNLLTMTAGFPEDNPWGDRQLEDTDEELESFLKKGVSFSSIPGYQFEYSNLGFATLGNIIKRVSGVPYQQYITKEILKPLGMNETHWEFSEIGGDKLALGYRWEDEQWQEEPMLHDGSYGAMGGLITSIEDFGKYVALHLSAWPPNNEDETGIIKRNSIREMHRPFMPRMFADAKTSDGSTCAIVVGYGYGLGYRQDCKGIVRISHSGGLPGFGSEFRFYPEYGVGVILFANRTYAGTGAANARVMDTLLLISGIKPRVLPASDILNKRKEQLSNLILSWDENLGQEILAENFFLDLSRDAWIKTSKETLAQIGEVISYEPMMAENQLRGYFIVNGKKGKLKVYFTLTPEPDPKVQELHLDLVVDENFRSRKRR